MRSTDQNHSNPQPPVPDQQRLDFRPLEATAEERERMRRLIAQWTLEEAEEDFKQLPGESLAEFMEARAQHLREIEAFGPQFPKEPSEAWQLVQGLRQVPRDYTPRQLGLPFDAPDTDTTK